MSKKPLVSVVIPFLNADKFIEEAIESVFSQTYEDWELLLVDDGSTDRSTDIALRYIDQFPNKVKYLEHDGHLNKGVCAARNAGILKAQGKFIALLDADDVWLPGKLKRQVAVMEQHPDVGLVFNPVFYCYETGEKEPRPSPLSSGRHPIKGWIINILENHYNAPSPTAVLLRKELALAVGGFEESFRGPLQLFEDVLAWCKMNLYAAIYYDPEYVALHRVHSASWWGTSSWEEQLFARTHLYLWIIQLLKEHGHFQFIPEVTSLMTLRVNCSKLRYFIDAKQLRAAEAIRQWTELQLPEPSDPEWNYLTAFIMHTSQTNSEEALKRYNRALDGGFDEFWVRYNRGSLQVQMGNSEQAGPDLFRAVELKPDHEGARQVLAQLSSTKGKSRN